MRGSPRRATVALALLAVTALAPVAASPRPTPLCPACGTQFERAAAERDVPVGVQESTVLVQVHGNGSATWTIRNRLNTTDGFRDDPGALDATARQLVTNPRGPPEGATLREARLEAGVAVIVLHDPDAAERRAGLLVVDYLHDRGREPRYRVNADRFSVRGPVGTVVTNTPTGAVEDGRTATWEGGLGDGYYAAAPPLRGSPYVVFGSAGAGGPRTAVALALATLPIVVGSVMQFVLLQTLLFGGLLAGVVAVVRRWEFDWGPRPFGIGFAIVGGLAVCLLVLTGLARWIAVPALAATGVGVALTQPAVRARRWTPRRLAGGALAALALGTGGASLLELATVPEPSARATVTSLAVALPFVACLPLGAALDDDRRRRLAWGVLAVAAFVAVPVAFADPADPPGGFGAALLSLFLIGLGGVAPVLSAPVLAAGRVLARREARPGDAGGGTDAGD